MNLATRLKGLVMSNSKVYVPPEFITDFELVADYYEYKKSGDYEFAKEMVKSDLANAIICYREMANNVRYWLS